MCVYVCVRECVSLLAGCLLLLVHLKLRARTVRLAVRARRFSRRLAREDTSSSALALLCFFV